MRLRTRHLVALCALTAPMALAPAAPATEGKDRGKDRGRDHGRVLHAPATADSTDAGSLRAAVRAANARPGADTIRLRPGRDYVLSLEGAGEDAGATGDLDVTDDLTIIGGGATIDGGAMDRVLDVASGARLHLRSAIVTGGAPPEGESGGGIRSAGDLTLSSVRVSGNEVDGPGASGGGVANLGGTLTAHRSAISGNDADRAGGGIEAVGGVTRLNRVHLTKNTAGDGPGNGGGLHLTGAGRVEVSRSWIRGNLASAEGGGLWNSAEGRMHVAGSVVVHNVASGADADQGGGGLFNDGGRLVVDRTVLAGNDADGAAGSGGAILNDLGDTVVARSRLSGNTAVRAGGGIEANAGETKLFRVTLTRNAAGDGPGNGGALHLTGEGDVAVKRSLVRLNRASAEGGGLWNSAAGTMHVRDSVVTHNVASGAAADQGGGGLFNDGGTLRVDDSTVSANEADGASGSGGGILNDLGTLVVTESVLRSNTSSRAGGAVEANAGDTRLWRVRMSGNATGDAPGNGGAVHLTGDGTVAIARAAIRANRAAAEGGGVWNSATGTTTVTDSVIRGNAAPAGPDVFNDGGAFTVDGDPVDPA